ncbi:MULTISPECIES: TIGR02186 family protein [unclassified Chelatococcus]|uniref:TIGR02186 family protein n=1 Tax=unclassified Chelatococcus TaxID=2638111 RepID=UPI001BD11A02|nr:MULTISPECIES: TIGR02186 family protein [unclassified Chelatococcus]MBS7696727.1 TIGR02186 family protein [Chelatococcus sp. YT9]MBX3555292.1 TIGR02186 family protein [Chelatococcus sp.]
MKRSALALLACLASMLPATAETLVTSLSTYRVAINSNYTGASLVLFGSIERDARTATRAAPYDLVVTVRGPRRTALVREKEPLGPLWITRGQRRFVDQPVYLAVVSSRAITDIAGEPVRGRLKLGLEAEFASPLPGANIMGEDFIDAFIRLRRQQHLFQEDPEGVVFLTRNLFRAKIDLPAIAPTGLYEVETILLSDGVALSRQSTNFEVEKTGFEQATVVLARDYGFLYGLIAAASALFLGWLATVVFRRE